MRHSVISAFAAVWCSVALCADASSASMRAWWIMGSETSASLPDPRLDGRVGTEAAVYAERLATTVDGSLWIGTRDELLRLVRLVEPVDVATAPDGSLVVADVGRLLRVSPEGALT